MYSLIKGFVRTTCLISISSLPFLTWAQTQISQPPSQAQKAAFKSLVHSYYPLTPGQVHQFKNISAEQQKANAMPAGNAPAAGTSNIIPVSLKTGGTAPIVRVGQGMITSLVFTDASGKVWPIVSYSVGDPKAFNIQWNKHSGVLMIQGQQLYAQSNIGVMLKGLNVPVMLTLLIGQKHWDYLDYARVDAYAPTDSGGAEQNVQQAPSYLITLLSGLAPKSAQKMVTSDSNVQVWSYDGHYLMLTHANLLSPAWTARQSGSGPNALHAYKLPVAPYILVSSQGSTERVKITAPAPTSTGGSL